MALYLRGSALSKNRRHEPWDIDFILVTDQKNQNIPIHFLPFDATIIDLSVLSSTEINSHFITYKKLEQASLLFGRDIRNECPPDITPDFIAHYIQDELLQIEEKLQTFKLPMSIQESHARKASYSKRLLRIGGILHAKVDKTLMRDPVQCAELLQQSVPSLQQFVRPLQSNFGQWDKMQAEDLLEFIKQLRSTFLWK